MNYQRTKNTLLKTASSQRYNQSFSESILFQRMATATIGQDGFVAKVALQLTAVAVAQPS